jgi:hypothetical protein
LPTSFGSNIFNHTKTNKNSANSGKLFLTSAFFKILSIINQLLKILHKLNLLKKKKSYSMIKNPNGNLWKKTFGSFGTMGLRVKAI